MRKLLLSVAATAMLATGAFAADVTAVPATYDSSGFDWDGFYVGLGITGGALSNGFSVGVGDVIAGVNMTSGDILFGVEGWIGGEAYSNGATGFAGGLEGRLGYLVAPEALVYLSGGGVASSAVPFRATLGAGVEFAVTDDISLDFEYKFSSYLGTAVVAHSIGASANWHFN